MLYIMCDKIYEYRKLDHTKGVCVGHVLESIRLFVVYFVGFSLFFFISSVFPYSCRVTYCVLPRGSLGRNWTTRKLFI